MDDKNPEGWLLDWHLNRLDKRRRRVLEDRLRTDSDLRAKSDLLAAILRPLDHFSAAPPTNLADSVMQSIRRIVGQSKSKRGLNRPTLRYFIPARDLLAAAACILILLGVMVPGISGYRALSKRSICADNMKSVFTATSIYQQVFRGWLPLAGQPAETSWLPNQEESVAFASNSRHIFNLLRTGLVDDASVFTCPSAPLSSPMLAAKFSEFEDFGDSNNVNYSFLNMGGPNPDLRIPPTTAYAADSSPLFENGRFQSTVSADAANSNNHKGRGQTVLTLDGSASMWNSPITTLGARKDNIWLAGNQRTYRGTETRASIGDSFLVPSLPVIATRADK